MPRSSKKGPYIDAKLLKKVSQLKVGDKTVIKTWARSAVITPEFIGFVMGVHNGKDFVSVAITEDMVGHKLDEFSLTRKFVKHGGKIQKGLETAAAAAAATKPAAGGKK